jgi:LacI family transcriptional regulator
LTAVSVTIKDVARLADCSIKTVSRVINNEPHVSEKVRARVLDAIRKSGYAPNLSARRLVQQRSFAICILLYPGFDQPTSSLLSRVLDIGYEESYEILLHSYFPMLAPSRNQLVERINQRRYDGYVITPPCDADGFLTDLLTTYKIPFVLINPLNRSTEFPYVAGSDYDGAYEMTEHLIQLGHQRISFFMGPRNMRSTFDRLNGYRAALDDHQIAFDPALQRDSEFTFDGGYLATRDLFTHPDPPTAIFAGSDTAAFGALFAAQELDISVPAQLSIAGHDDLPAAKTIFPGLTTVHQPGEELIEQAVRLLIDIVDGRPDNPAHIVLPSHLVLRASTAPPR